MKPPTGEPILIPGKQFTPRMAPFLAIQILHISFEKYPQYKDRWSLSLEQSFGIKRNMRYANIYML